MGITYRSFNWLTGMGKLTPPADKPPTNPVDLQEVFFLSQNDGSRKEKVGSPLCSGFKHGPFTTVLMLHRL